MKVRVLKFGGSCLSGADGLRRLGELLKGAEGGTIVVLSGVKDSTDMLESYIMERSRSRLASFAERHLDLARELLCDPGELDEFKAYLASEMLKLKGMLDEDDEAVPRWVREHAITYGERIAVNLAAIYLESIGVRCRPLRSEDAGIAAVGDFGRVEADLGSTCLNLRSSIGPLLEAGEIPLITGFYGILPDGKAATFGRNGSDYLASVVARCMGADEVVLYKDVRGFLSADPEIVPEARLLEEITFDEATELSRFGAKVVHPRTFEPLMGSGIPVRICDVEDPLSVGTRLVQSRDRWDGAISITSRLEVSCLRMAVRDPGPVAAGALKALSGRGIQTLSVVPSRSSVGVLVGSADGPRAHVALEEASLVGVDRIGLEDDLAIVGLVGGDLKVRPDLLEACFFDLWRKSIPVRMAGSGSESAFYVIVEEKDALDAVRVLHASIASNMGDMVSGMQLFQVTTPDLPM